jgi:hypothetical protein
MRLTRMKSILDALEGSTFEQGPSFKRAEQLEAISLLKREIELAEVAVKPAEGSRATLSFPRSAPTRRAKTRPRPSPEPPTAQHQEEDEQHQRQ